MSVVTVGTHGGVPVRTILTTIGLVAAAAVAWLFVMRVERRPDLDARRSVLRRRSLPAGQLGAAARVLRRRSLATLLVFLVVLITIGATLSAFAVPLAQEGTQLAGQLPVLINDARAGRGPVGRLLERTNAVEFVQNNEDTNPRVRDRSRHACAQRAARREHRARRDRDDLRPGLPGRARRTEGRHGHTRSSPAAARPADSDGSPTTAPRPSPAISPATCSSARSAARSPTPCSRSSECRSPA